MPSSFVHQSKCLLPGLLVAIYEYRLVRGAHTFRIIILRGGPFLFQLFAERRDGVNSKDIENNL